MNPALMSAEELLGHYRTRRLSPVEALQAVTERIARLNPGINAFAVLNPRAMRDAGDSATRWMAGRPIGPLDGVPVTVKDLIDLAGFPTRRGSRATSTEPVTADAPISLGLKAAGAVIIGKTTTTEYGWKTPGDCPLHGITRNPWDRGRTTGGSSSGAGAAGAAGFGPLHIGTDAGGSVRLPAAWCGLVGLKPSFGLIPQWPAGAFANVAAAGPMTRTVRDNALLLGAIARFDVRDPFCLPDQHRDYQHRDWQQRDWQQRDWQQRGWQQRDWRAGIEEGVAGLRVAVLRRPGFDAPVDAEGIAAVERAAGLLQGLGAEVEAADPQIPDASQVFGRVWGVALARLVAATPPEQRALLDAGLLEVAAAESGMSAIDFLGVEATRIEIAHRMALFMQRYDLVLCPTVPGPPLPADAPTTEPGRALMRDWAPWTFTFNLSRQPAITIPMGLGSGGLPLSVQLAAALYRDDLVFRAARALELAAPFPVLDAAA
jgi:aspartyl-tRNA(Asn)/glutamyl-tRNA(Gln) amidotransferase subunit A